jgi:Family of unknown function (DUF6152)
MSRLHVGLLALLSLVLAAVPALAHHSINAEFDPHKNFTVTGVMKRIDWTNPHIYWYVDVKDANGKVETYRFQGANPRGYHRAGLKKDDWKIGEVVTVSAKAAKDGTSLEGFATQFKYSDGHAIVLDH